MARNTLKNICRLLDAVNNQLSPEQSFVVDLRRAIELDAQANARKPSQSYKPSSMNCIRGMWYQMMGVELDMSLPNYSMVGIGWSGSDTHIRVQDIVSRMRDYGGDCEYVDVAEYVKEHNLDYLDIVAKSGPETKLYHKELHMSFLCDGVILYNGVHYILEIKTEAGFKFQRREGVDEKHHNQGTAYSLALKIPRVMFLYINRDMFDFKAYIFNPTDEQRENIVGLITECDGYVSRMICPPKPENIQRRICEYCGYKARCRTE